MDAPRRPIAALGAGLLARKGLARRPVLPSGEGEALRVNLQPEAGEAPEVLANQLARTARATEDRAAFTLRLDAERRLRLRLASVVTGRSAQQLVTEAIDSMLNDMTELEPLARRVAGSEG